MSEVIEEEWKEHKVSRLLVSNFGRVKNPRTGTIRKWKNRNGYAAFAYTKGGRPQGRPPGRPQGNRLGIKQKQVHHQIHRVVAQLFLPFDKPETISEEDWLHTPESVKIELKNRTLIDHIDRDKMNPHISNLRWATWKQNSENVA